MLIYKTKPNRGKPINPNLRKTLNLLYTDKDD